MIRIQHLTKSYADEKILDNLQLEIKDHARLGIVGENGCGKTTLMNLLSGKETCDQGSLTIPKNGVIAYMEQVQPTAEDETLSGGERTLVALKRLFSDYSNILLLDEPTNHLDYKGIHWLITLLQRYPGTVIIVSHDRYFLDLVCDEIYELRKTQGTLYSGNYTAYKAEKQHRYITQKNAYEKDLKTKEGIKEDIATLSSWSEKAHRESRTKGNSGVKMGTKEYFRAKAKKRDQAVKSNVKRLEKLLHEGLVKPEEDTPSTFKFREGVSTVNQPIYCESLTMCYGDTLLFTTTNFSIRRSEKIALVGLNGSGKTTFIRLLQGTVSPIKGRLTLNASLNIGYLNQDVIDLDPNKTVIDSFGFYAKDKLTLARIQLNNLGINKDMIHRKINTLSMGERTRVKLAMILLEPYDLLILDEPTNHLDLLSKELLEEALSQYKGTLLIVSHDMYFIKALCTDMLLIENSTLSRLGTSPEQWLTQLNIM
jgi:macrolide transport system ATP-binding/permease protein